MVKITRNRPLVNRPRFPNGASALVERGLLVVVPHPRRTPIVEVR